jgi:hypothetical protein
MDYNGLVVDLANLQVDPPDTLRASLYIDYLQATHNYLTVTLNAPAPGGLTAAGFLFSQGALTSSTLLNELAEILDLYIGAAVDSDLKWQYLPAQGHGPVGPNPWTYRQYFDNSILDANPATFATNIANFRLRNPISAQALFQATAHFQANIKLCCERVFADRAQLILFFNSLYTNTLAITALTSIKSSGSDFHKGGKQVLILGFHGTYQPGPGPAVTAVDFKAIYKPSDLEADCLIAGDSAVVNAVIPGFMIQSLFEIYNATLAGDPNLDGLPLNTYRILPRNYNSLHGGGYPLPIRQAYGYIEYLNNDLSWNGNGWFGLYPSGVSDYVVFKTQSSNIIHDFYQRAGAFGALACSFSIVDMHIENFRVRQYNPYPIDLEISLTKALNDFAATSLTGNLGGLTGVSVGAQDFKWDIANENVPGQAAINQQFITVYEANRLYSAERGQQKALVPVDAPYLFAGFQEGMDVIQAAQIAGNFNAWFLRLNDVVVRYLPFATSTFKRVFSNIYYDYWPVNTAFAPTLANQVETMLSIEYGNYVANNLPNFLAFQAGIAVPEYQNLDIPVFYYRINGGSLDAVDSNGAAVPIPVTIPIINNPVAPCAALVGRPNYFPAAPMPTNVRAPQVTALAVPANFLARYNLLEQSLLAALGLHAVPAVPQSCIPNFCC